MSAAEDRDCHWMRLALREAHRGIGLTSPNPPVGAVIVSSGGDLIAKGWHRRAGGPHAEIEALHSVPPHRKSQLKSATLYVTLEPCTSHGRTPPCVEAIAAAGLRRVVWAVDDPNPLHTGRAAKALQNAGIATNSGSCREEAAELLRPWTKFITTGIPWVIGKTGMSLDGRITRPVGEGPWLTSETSRRAAMRLRLRCDAILVGAETVRQDNPRLTLRDVPVPAGKVPPWRVILTRSGKIPADCRLLTDDFRDRTLVFANQPLSAALKSLADRGVVSVLLEGGGIVLAQAFAQGLVDEFHAWIAPLVSGTGKPVVDPVAFGSHGSIPLRLASCRRSGPDVFLKFLRE